MGRLHVPILGLILGVVFIVSLRMSVLAQEGTTYEITLEELGYRDALARGPSGNIYYYFSTPPDWIVQEGSEIVLDVDYTVNLVNQTTYPPAVLQIWFNEHLLDTVRFSAPTSQIEHVQLPPELFKDATAFQLNTLKLSFVDYNDCHSSTITILTVKKSSQLRIAYQLRPLELDLARFPQPFYLSHSLQSPHVRFVLPDHPTAEDVRAAIIVATRLGQLTGNGVPISVTRASEYPGVIPLSDHLIVVGTPYENNLLPRLPMPIKPQARQLKLTSQMPVAVAEGQVFGCFIHVANTTSVPKRLIVEDEISPDLEVLGCGSCERVSAHRMRWTLGDVGPGHTRELSLTLRAAPLITETTFVRHTATLLDPHDTVLNEDTLTARIDPAGSSDTHTSANGKPADFFAWGKIAVPADAGVLEAFPSPWNAHTAIFAVTGLTGEAVCKAAQGLNPRNHFPGPSGNIAFVSDLRPKPEQDQPLPELFSLASLGYSDMEISVLDMEGAGYTFDFPMGKTLGDEAFFALHLSHAEIIAQVGGSIKITLNQVPIGSVGLDDSNLTNAWIKIPLSRSAIRPGKNRLYLQTSIKQANHCLVKLFNPYWLEIYDDSFFHLTYQAAEEVFTLKQLPYPLERPGNLDNVLFVLPASPGQAELEGALRFASYLGGQTGDHEFTPHVQMSEQLDETELRDYHIVAFGLPLDNPVIQRANVKLPLPFAPQSNQIYQDVDSPIYGIPPGTDLGVIEELPSPWDAMGRHVLLIASGNSPLGVRWALDELTQRTFDLTGNLAIVRQDQVHAIDTYPVAIATVFPNVFPTATPLPALPTPTPYPTLTPTPSFTPTPTLTPTVTAEDEAPKHAHPIWVLPLLVLSTITLIGAAILSMRK